MTPEQFTDLNGEPVDMLLEIPPQNPDAPYKWSGAGPVPAIGARVRITFNELQFGAVIGYEITGEWLGVHVRLESNPAWRTAQGVRLETPAYVFGAEIEVLE